VQQLPMRCDARALTIWQRVAPLGIRRSARVLLRDFVGIPANGSMRGP
jgi:hypothetical protein